MPDKPYDNEYLRPRAKVTLRLAALVSPNAADSQDIHRTFDLFDPPVHIRHLAACKDEKAKDPELRLRDIAARLGINYMTVKRALDYSQLMDVAGTKDPYREVIEKPESASRWLRRNRES